MFTNPFQILHISRLRELEKKWLKSQLTDLYPSITDYRFTNDFLSKRDCVEHMKIKTFNSKYIDVYVVNDQPMAFFYRQLFPTVYFLWEYPECLLYFTTYISIADKLGDGTVLLLQCVAYPKFTNSLHSVAVFERNTPVYVNQSTNKAAVAVGVTVENSMTLCKRKHRGKCVYIYHFFKDWLCTINNIKLIPLPELGYPEWMKESMKSISNIDLPKTQPVNRQDESLVTDKCVGTDDKGTRFETLDKRTMDKLLLRCFLATVRHSKSLKLPISVTLFCDTYIKSANSILQVYSYETYIEFIEKLAKEGLVMLGEEEGVYSILKVNYDHSTVRNFMYDPEEIPKVQVNNNAPLLAVENCYTVTTTILPIFQPFGFITGSVILATEVEGYIMGYIKYYCLQSKSNTFGLVYLNDFLRYLLRKDCDNGVKVETVVFEVVSRMTKCYKITSQGLQTISKGELKPIKIRLGFLCNCKKVTIVKNIEIYHISLNDVANDCGISNNTCIKIYKKVCSKKSHLLYIYGDQVIFVYNLLNKKYGVPEECIKTSKPLRP